MKRWEYPFLFVFIFLVGCKTDKINGNSIREFQESVNKMSSGAKTIRQVKFREALHIIKQFGIEEGDNLEKISTMARMLHGKKLQEIFSLADSIASINQLDWSSYSPPSLENIDVFLNNGKYSDSLKIDSLNIFTEEDYLIPLNEIPKNLVYSSLDEPEAFVSKFLQNISEKRLLEAYKMSDNPDWESFEIFSNPNSGFGSVEHISIENIVVEAGRTEEINVNAEYIVTDNLDKKIKLNVSFVLRIYARNWKIIHYKINSTHKL